MQSVRVKRIALWAACCAASSACSSSGTEPTQREPAPYFEKVEPGEYIPPAPRPEEPDPRFDGEGQLEERVLDDSSWTLPSEQTPWVHGEYDEVVFHALKQSTEQAHRWHTILSSHVPPHPLVPERLTPKDVVPLFQYQPGTGLSQDEGVYGWMVVPPIFAAEKPELNPIDAKAFVEEGGRLFTGIEFPDQKQLHVFECPWWDGAPQHYYFWNNPYVWGEHIVDCKMSTAIMPTWPKSNLTYLFRHPDNDLMPFYQQVLDFAAHGGRSSEDYDRRHEPGPCKYGQVSEQCEQAPVALLHLLFVKPDGSYRVVSKLRYFDFNAGGEVPFNVTEGRPFLEERVICGEEEESHVGCYSVR